MQSKHAGEKLDKIANIIIFGFWAGSQYYLYGLLLSGMLIRAVIQTFEAANAYYNDLKELVSTTKIEPHLIFL